MHKRWGFHATLLMGVFLMACPAARDQVVRLQVDEERLEQLSEQQLQPVETARRRLEQAENELASADRAIEQARQRQQMGEADVQVAEAELQRQRMLAESLVEEGQDVEDHPVVRRARERIEADQARARYLQEMISVAEGEREEARQRVTLARAELEWAKYTALRQADPEAARELDARGPDFERQVAEAEALVAEARAQTSEHRSEALGYYDQWIEHERQIQPPGRRAVAPEDRPTPRQ